MSFSVTKTLQLDNQMTPQDRFVLYFTALNLMREEWIQCSELFNRPQNLLQVYSTQFEANNNRLKANYLEKIPLELK
jgi:hypothetical protein